MEKRIIIKWALTAFTVISFTGCTKWLDVQPTDRMTEEQVFSTPEGFHSTLYGIYTELLSSNLYGGALNFEMIDIMGQLYTIKSANPNYTEIVNYKYTSEYMKARLQGTWDASYKVILNCNKILENMEKYDVLNESDKNLIKGEVLALRAFLHFDLLRLFGPVMLTAPKDASIPYSEKIGVSATELMRADSLIEYKIIRDLNTAEELLRTNDPILAEGPMSFADDDNNTYKARVLRMNYYAVLALKARVYLYANNKTEASKYARMVLDAPEREDYFPFITPDKIQISTIKNPDRIFSTEVIFALYNPDRGKWYNDNFDPETASNNLLAARPFSIENHFTGEEDDYRYLPIWKTSTLPGDRSRVFSKFKNIEDKTIFNNNMVPLIRLSELYLIAAECEAIQDDGMEYLSKLRLQRGLTRTTGQFTTLLTNEYFREFVGEGQLFFFYKRRNEMFVTSGITGGGVMMTRGNYLVPLPESETKYRD